MCPLIGLNLQICKRVNTIIETNPTLQYIIELTVAGYVPNHPVISRLSARDLLNEFTEQCTVRKDSVINLDFSSEKIYELPNEVVNWKYCGGYAVWLRQ